MLNHPIGQMISDKDRPILGYLQNIELELHSEDKGQGYDLIFRFEPNSYFEGTEIRKELYMKHKGMTDRTVSTQIKWKDNCDPTIQKKKKKKKGKKVNVTEKVRSFFNFFKDKDPAQMDEEEEEEEDDDMDDQQEIADQIKDDLVPLALEYYLGVIEIDEESDDDDDSDDDKKKGDGSDDDDGAKKKKKKGKKGGGQVPPGVDPQDCKQQ